METIKPKFNKKDFHQGIGHPSSSFDDLVEIVKKFGIYVYDDPTWEGNSDYGFIVSKIKLNKKELNEVSELLNPECYEEDEE